jgi:hypothetical protein
MKFFIDLNLSPRWVEVFMAAGLKAGPRLAIIVPQSFPSIYIQSPRPACRERKHETFNRSC